MNCGDSKASTKLWKAMGCCPHFPGSLSGLTLPMMSKYWVNSHGEVWSTSDLSDVPQVPVMAGILHKHQLRVLYPSLSSTMEQLNPNKQLLLTTQCLGGEQTPESHLQAEVGPHHSGTPGAVWAKERRGKCPCSCRDTIESPQ